MRNWLQIFAVAIVLTVLTMQPAAAQQGQRASVTDVSKEARGESTTPTGPGGMPRPEKTEDGRDYYYFEPLNLMAIRDHQPVRKYTLFTRIILGEDTTDDDINEAKPLIRDALILALTDMAQVDWGGEAGFDQDLASRIAKDHIEAIIGEGSLDGLDFPLIQVQVF